MADAIDAVIKQIKKIQEKIDALEAKGLEADDLRDKIAELEGKLNKSPDFGDWE